MLRVLLINKNNLFKNVRAFTHGVKDIPMDFS